ncbi:LPXTG cell wall anchor domain-containing protein [Georgenia sp. MJ173]|uniref:LPXTG cell wall anchor domain-containing protein n=1 Tax=Georgenia sunbinii TaxID=3117728 RepID=UPI002F2600E7
MRKTIVLTLRALMLVALFVTVPFAAHAQEDEPGADVGVEVEITPTATEEPTGPTADPTADPTDPTVPPMQDATTPAADGELGQTGFAGLPVLIAAAGLIVVGGGVLLYRRRRTT